MDKRIARKLKELEFGLELTSQLDLLTYLVLRLRGLRVSPVAKMTYLFLWLDSFPDPPPNRLERFRLFYEAHPEAPLSMLEKFCVRRGIAIPSWAQRLPLGQKKRGRHAKFEQRMKQQLNDLLCFVVVRLFRGGGTRWKGWDVVGEGPGGKGDEHKIDGSVYVKAADFLSGRLGHEWYASTVKRGYMKIQRRLTSDPTSDALACLKD